MVDFTTPNLCGASEQFNKLAGQFSSIKDSLQGQLEGEIDALKSELTSSLSVLEADIKGLIPELPDIPDISLISEVQNFLALPAGSSASLNALTSLTSQFGAGLAAAGQDLDSLISTASGALSGGIDLCGGTIPNFVIGPNGIPTLKPEDSGMPDTDPERLDEDGKLLAEPASSLSTPSAEISSVNASIESDADSAASNYQEQTAKVPVVIASESGELSNKTKKEFDKADAVAEAAAVKAKVPAKPQTAKVKDAVSTNKTLPPKKKVIEITDDDRIEIESLKILQDEVAEFANSYTAEFERLMHLLNKHSQAGPFNVTADGKRRVVFKENQKARIPVPPFQSKGDNYNIKQFIKLFTGRERTVKRRLGRINEEIRERIDFINGGSITTFTGRDPEDGSTFTKTIRAPASAETLERRFQRDAFDLPGIFSGLSMQDLIGRMEEAYTIAEKSFTVPI